MNGPFVALIGSLIALGAGTSMAQEVVVDLGHDVAFAVVEDTNARSVRVDITDLADDLQSVSIGDAGFTPDEMRTVKFCRDCTDAYFLPIWNASHPDDFVTGVIVYERGPGGWRLAILPFDRPTVEDRDGDGIFTLVDHPWVGEPEEYVFDNGLLAVAR